MFHHHHPKVPFEEHDSEIAELRHERRRLCSLIEDQRVALAKLERQTGQLRAENARLHRQLAERRRWWQR